MPECAIPIIQSQHVSKLNGCYWTETLSDGCRKYYRKATRTQVVENYSETVIDGFVVKWSSDDYQKERIETRVDTIGGCTTQIECSASGTSSSASYFVRRSNVPPFSIIAVFPQQEVMATLSMMGGMPDPSWYPQSGQTEDDRPILPPCTFMFTIVTKDYTATIGPDGRVTGSTLSSTTTTYNNQGSAVSAPFVFSEELTCDDVKNQTVVPDFDDNDTNYGAYPLSQYVCDPCSTSFSGVRIAKSRFRWVVPPEHGGSYFRIDWDEVFYPQSFLDWQSNSEPLPPPVIPTLTAKSWEWNGEALGECCGDPPDSSEDRMNNPDRRSPWGVIEAPISQGRVEIANVRYICYRSPYGQKPNLLDGFSIINLDDYNAN
jgi:hypothetical protein